MKQSRSLFLLCVLVGSLLTACQGIKEASKVHSPEGVARYVQGSQVLTVTYSRPYKKGRLIFGEKSAGALVPYGKKWRTGANEATEIALSQAVRIAGAPLAAGTYSLYSIPGPSTWTLAFNARTRYWGATIPGSPFRTRKDVLRIEVPARVLPQVVEQLDISFRESGRQLELVISWDQVEVAARIEVEE